MHQTIGASSGSMAALTVNRLSPSVDLTHHVQPNAGELQPFDRPANVLLVAGKAAVESLQRGPDIEGAVASSLQQRLVAWSQGRRSADGRVAKDLLQHPDLTINVLLAHAYLVVDLVTASGANSMNSTMSPQAHPQRAALPRAPQLGLFAGSN